MEMRLGKTPTILNEAMAFINEFGFTRVLVISPNKYKSAWASEAKRFGFKYPVYVFHSSHRKHYVDFAHNHPRFMVVVNYEALTYEDNTKVVLDTIDHLTYVAADESVLIKNRSSLASKSCMKIAQKCGVVRAATGKPAPQDVTDLYSQFRFLRQYEGVNFFQFKNTYAVTGGFRGKQVTGVKNEDRLNRNMYNFSFKAFRADWGTKIEPDYETVKVPLSPRLQKAYEDMEKEFMVWLDNNKTVAIETMLSKHIKLQQISSGFIYGEDGAPHIIEPFEKTNKCKELIDRVDNYINGKVIIIAVFKPTIDNLMRAMAKYNPACIPNKG